MSREKPSTVQPQFCFRRSYMNKGYLSPEQLCHDCPHEIVDLFSGTSGVEIWGWICRFNPVGELENGE
jgi:hypothetical protein